MDPKSWKVPFAPGHEKLYSPISKYSLLASDRPRWDILTFRITCNKCKYFKIRSVVYIRLKRYLNNIQSPVFIHSFAARAKINNLEVLCHVSYFRFSFFLHCNIHNYLRHLWMSRWTKTIDHCYIFVFCINAPIILHNFGSYKSKFRWIPFHFRLI